MFCSGSFLHFARANASRAYAHLLPVAGHQRMYPLQVRIPAPPSRVVRVADYVPEMRTLAAQFTLHRHIISRFFGL